MTYPNQVSDIPLSYEVHTDTQILRLKCSKVLRCNEPDDVYMDMTHEFIFSDEVPR